MGASFERFLRVVTKAKVFSDPEVFAIYLLYAGMSRESHFHVESNG